MIADDPIGHEALREHTLLPDDAELDEQACADLAELLRAAGLIEFTAVYANMTPGQIRRSLGLPPALEP